MDVHPMSTRTLLAGLLAGLGVASVLSVTSFTVADSPEPSAQSRATRESIPELLEPGQAVYRRQCAACHGATGAGDGEAAYLLYPKPRNFVRGQFRFVSTWDGLPTNEDLFRSISRGIPGSAMPSWAHLPAEERRALVRFIRSFSEEPVLIPPRIPPDPKTGAGGQGVVEVPAEPLFDRTSVEKGRDLFVEHCASCHGPGGRGDGPTAATLEDDAGFPIRPRDLTSGVLKGSPRPEDLYRRIVAGIPGTPMPRASLEDPGDGWHLVHFVLSLSSERLRERAEMKRFRIEARRVERIPDHPDAGEWRDARPVNLHLMPLWWRYDRPEYVTVQALHDGQELALLLTWSDATHDVWSSEYMPDCTCDISSIPTLSHCGLLALAAILLAASKRHFTRRPGA